MSSIVPIEDVPPYVQSIATSLQTVFDTNFTADEDTDVVVYARADGVEPDDATQLIDPANYTVSYVGVDEIVRVTFLVGRTLDDVVTIMRMTPVERLNLYTNTNFTTSMLNGDFGKQTMMIQEREYCDDRLAPKYNNNATVVNTKDIILPILGAGQAWRKNDGNTAIEVVDVPDGGIAPDDATYLLQTADASLPNAQAMGALASGLVVNTTTTGVQLTRTLTGTASEIDVADGTGIAGNPTVGIADNPLIPGTAGMGIPQGTTAQRVTPVSGIGLRYNTDLNAVEYYDGGWIQLDDADLSLYLLLAGGTMSGDIDMDNVARVINALDPVNPQDYATKAYVDGGGGGPPYLPLAGGTMTGDIDFDNTYTGINVIDPTNPQDIATKNYVDQTALTGTSVYAATTANLNATQSGAGVGATLTDASGTFAAFTTDGTSPAVGDLILNKDQTNAAHQGIYELTTNGDTISVPWVLTRATTYNTPAEINQTGLIVVRNGTTLAGSSWYNADNIVTVDTTNFDYVRFGSIYVESVTGTANEIDVDNTDPQNPILSLSATLDFSGTFTVQNTVDIDEILDEDNMASDSATALATQQSIKYYADHLAFIYDNNGNLVWRNNGVASAVNYIGTQNNATGATPLLEALGTDTNIILALRGKGTGGVEIEGTGTNDNAATGYVGEVISSTVLAGSGVGLTTATDANITSISLTAGDWDVYGSTTVIFTADHSAASGWVSLTSATVPDQALRSVVAVVAGSPTLVGGSIGGPTPYVRVSIASTTTVYLSVRATFSSGTATGCGFISARRMR